MRLMILPVLFAAATATAAHAQDAAGDAALKDKAKAMFEATAAATCDPDGPGSEDNAPESHAIGFRYSYDAEEDPERTAHLFRFFCFSGAYNEIHVYYITDGEGALAPLHFAEPQYDVRYAGESDEKVEAVAITGFAATGQLVNSGYDPETRTITAHSLWRGVGDASSTGTWTFVDGTFRLVQYEVDASYDGEINPQAIVDYR
ncbi:MAG: DUF1176 domain-containing protein [Aquamicrobium sp.]|uniref:DUF1176 domain-containing protein n=1 Tax=Aquamicrobium sp. TaxID=1872579 RepID=UPI00349E66CA|nr:DUF1176 domain-containing protein [Aquamicrobium sp.]